MYWVTKWLVIFARAVVIFTCADLEVSFNLNLIVLDSSAQNYKYNSSCVYLMFTESGLKLNKTVADLYSYF